MSSTNFAPAARHHAAARIALLTAALVGSAGVSFAQTVPDHKRGFEFVVSSGRLLPVGDQRDALKRGDLTQAQLSYRVLPGLALTSSLGWARSRDIVTVNSPKLDVFTYDVGAELRADRWLSAGALSFSPFAGAGGGARSYHYRSLDVDATHNLAAYASAGGDIGYRRVHLRLEARNNVSGFKPLMLNGQSGRRNDVTVMAGFRITAH